MIRSPGLMVAGLLVLASCAGGQQPAVSTAPVPPPTPADETSVPLAQETEPQPATEPQPETLQAGSNGQPKADDGASDRESAPREGACERGDADACLEIADVAFQRRDHDLAITMAYSLCQRGQPAACFRAAYYMKRLGIRQRLGTSPSQLRDRGVTLYEGECEKGDAPACFGYGKMLFTGDHVTADRAAGKRHLETSCTKGHAPACSFLASLYETGHGGVKKDRTRALQLLENACNAGGAASCTASGDRIARQDKGRARARYQKACDGDDAAGCARLGQVHLEAGKHVEALAAFLNACDLEHRASCVDAGVLTAAGKGTNKDPAKARELYQLACDHEIGAGCLSLAVLVAQGAGGKRNWGQAVELSEKACSLKHEQGCKEAARLKRGRPDWRCATETECEALCEERIGKACTKLGDLRVESEIAEVLKEQEDDPEPLEGWGSPSCLDAEEAYDLGCKYDDGRACMMVGILMGESGYSRRGYDHREDVYVKACRLGQADGCILRDFYRYEDASPRQRDTIARSLETRCGGGKHALACVLFAKLGPATSSKSAMLLRRACDRGSAMACGVLADELRSLGATSSDWAEMSHAERRAEEERSQEYLRLVKRACALGDYRSCVNGDDDMKARARELLESRSCGRGGVEF